MLKKSKIVTIILVIATILTAIIISKSSKIITKTSIINDTIAQNNYIKDRKLAYIQEDIEENITEIQQTTITRDTTIHLYYNRDRYNVNLNKGENIETVTAKATGETLGSATRNFKVGQSVIIEAVRKNITGHSVIWGGWTGTFTNENNPYTFTMPANDVTLTATATATPENYTITFDPNEGNVDTTSKTVTYNSVFGELPKPAREGYIFEGWYAEQDGETKIQSTDIVKITSDKTFYAKWELAVAKIGTEDYSSIQKAIDSIPDSTTQTTIEVLVSHSVSNSITNNKNVILNLGEKEIIIPKYLELLNQGDLQIKNGSLKTEGNYTGIENSGNLNLETSFKFMAESKNGLVNKEGGTVIISGAEIIHNYSNDWGTIIKNAGNMTINSGKIYDEDGSKSDNILYNSGILNINGGEIKGASQSGAALMNLDGYAYIYGGTIDMRKSNNYCVYNCGETTIGKSGTTLYIYGSETGMITIDNQIRNTYSE